MSAEQNNSNGMLNYSNIDQVKVYSTKYRQKHTKNVFERKVTTSVEERIVERIVFALAAPYFER